MRKALPHIVLLLLVAYAATGCDFFRRLAGRPTSSEIEAMRQAIALKEEARKQEAPDTVSAVPETVAVQEAPKATEAPKTAEAPKTVETPKPAVQPAPVKETVSSSSTEADGKKRYYIIVASFSKIENAERCAERMADRGYPGELLKFKGGYTAVGVLGTDDMQEAQASLKELKRQDFCPQGVWILDRNRK